MDSKYVSVRRDTLNMIIEIMVEASDGTFSRLPLADELYGLALMVKEEIKAYDEALLCSQISYNRSTLRNTNRENNHES